MFLNGIHNAFFDVIFYWVTSKIFWIPFYGLILYWVAKTWGWKTFIIGVFFGLLFVLGDRISVVFFKDVFQRLRPCYNPEIEGMVHILDGYCGGKYGFVSSHATNSFALASFTILMLKNHYKFISVLMIFWAILVSYSRIYVGVHYPVDIIGGAILGTIIGFFVFWLLKKMNSIFKLNLKV